jgi:predicted kinase
MYMYAIAYVLFLPYCQKHGITAYCYWHSPHNQPTHIVPCTFRSENFVTPTEALRSVPLLYPYPKTIPKPWPSHATYSFKYVYTASKRKSASNFAEMSGATGSGKSALASLLAQSLNGIVINHDLLKSFLLENGLSTSFNQVAKLTYNLQCTLAEDVIKQGRTVIIDSTCNYEETLTHGAALAERYGFEYKYAECKVNDIDLLDQRLHSRVSLRSQRKGVNIPPPDASILLGADFDYRAQYKN